jgi:hypothetical protein
MLLIHTAFISIEIPERPNLEELYRQFLLETDAGSGRYVIGGVSKATPGQRGGSPLTASNKEVTKESPWALRDQLPRAGQPSLPCLLQIYKAVADLARPVRRF